jgi:hypothetical protein
MPVGHVEQCVLEFFRPRVGVILATIRTDATAASEIDCFCGPTVYTLVK